MPVSPSTHQTRKQRNKIVQVPLTLSQHFQECLSIELFRMHCHIVFNDLLCVATFADVPSQLQFQPQDHSGFQKHVTRYFFAQFWCELTKKVISDFLSEDLHLQLLQSTHEQQ